MKIIQGFAIQPLGGGIQPVKILDEIENGEETWVQVERKTSSICWLQSGVDVFSDRESAEVGFEKAIDAAVATHETAIADLKALSLIGSLDPEPVHLWFELTYAQYLTVPRSILQAMPVHWQQRFVQCLEELDQTFDWQPKEGRYHVRLTTEEERWDEEIERYVDAWGVELHDPLMEYRRPNCKLIKSLRRHQAKGEAHD